MKTLTLEQYKQSIKKYISPENVESIESYNGVTNFIIELAYANYMIIENSITKRKRKG